MLHCYTSVALNFTQILEALWAKASDVKLYAMQFFPTKILSNSLNFMSEMSPEQKKCLKQC